MAQDLGSLYISLGLSLSELETSFIAASRTVTENIRRLNRESELIRIRSEVQIAGLDEAADAERILQIRQNALNEQMRIQRDRVRILNAELRSLTATHGANSAAVQRATLRLERERLALANLEREAQNLNDTSGETNGFFGELNSMLPEMPTKLGLVAGVFKTLGAGIAGAAVATKQLLDEFREMQNQSYELNMSFPDTQNFLRQLRLAGGDIGDFEGYIRGITDAWVKGEYDDPEFIALRKYGAEIVDETGRLKNFKDLTEEVFQAWEKAEAAGEGIEFLQLTGGESGIRDAIQLFQRWKEAKEDAAKIAVADIDTEQLHQLDRTMNLVTEQADELKKALGDIFVPAVQAAAESFFNTLHDGTQFLVENKDEFQKWGFVAAEVFDTISEKIGGFKDSLAEIAKAPKNTTGDADADKIMSGMGWRYQEFNQQTPWGVNTSWDDFNKASKESYGIFREEVERAREKQKNFNGEVQGTTKSVADFRRENEETYKAIKDKNPLNQYDWKRINELKEEIEDLRIEIEFADNEIEKAKKQLEVWRDRELGAKNFLSDAERTAITDLYSTKLEKLKQEHSEKIAESIKSHMETAADIEYEMTHTAFEKQLRDIERWKEAQREKAETAEEISAIIAESAAKEAQAFENAVDRIKGKLQSLDDEIFEQEHSQYENDLRRIQQKRFRYYEYFQKEGMLNAETKAKIERWYQNSLGKLNARAAKGGDYTKAPDGMQRGGNGIVVIGGDKIIDDGLIRGQQQAIGLLTDENRIRAQLKQNLNADARATVERIQATKGSTDAQKEMLQSAQQNASGFTLIEGDKIVEQPQIMYDALPTQELEEFGTAVEQASSAEDEAAKAAADAQKSFTDGLKNFPPEYFKNLADSAKSVSEMQNLLTKSTLKLIDAQGNLAKELSSLKPQGEKESKPTAQFTSLKQEQLSPANTTQEPQKKVQQPTGDLKLGFSWDAFSGISQAALGALGVLATLGGIHPASIATAGVVALGAAVGGGLGFGTWDATEKAREGNSSGLYPAMDLSALETSLGTIDQNVQDILQEIQDKQIDFSEIATPLSSIDESFQTFLQGAGEDRPHEDDRLQELFGSLPNIEENLKSILLELQGKDEENNLSELLSPLPTISEDVQSILQTLTAKENPDAAPTVTESTGMDAYKAQLDSMDTKLQPLLQSLSTPEEQASTIDYLTPLSNIDSKIQSVLTEIQGRQPVTFETIITPLDSINSLVRDILITLGNRQPTQITVSPSNSINLGGAYVFDNAMKQSLVNDITSTIVDKITSAVQQAVSQSSYGYSA